MALLFVAFAFAKECTKEDLRSAACWATCRQEGYDSGTYSKNFCECVRRIKFEDMTKPIEILNVPPTTKARQEYQND